MNTLNLHKIRKNWSCHYEKCQNCGANSKVGTSKHYAVGLCQYCYCRVSKLRKMEFKLNHILIVEEWKQKRFKEVLSSGSYNDRRTWSLKRLGVFVNQKKLKPVQKEKREIIEKIFKFLKRIVTRSRWAVSYDCCTKCGANGTSWAKKHYAKGLCGLCYFRRRYFLNRSKRLRSKLQKEAWKKRRANAN